jgi:hypothetical protein
MTLVCKRDDCGKVLDHRQNKTGYCKVHANQMRKGDPAFKARMREVLIERNRDPEYRAKLSQACKRSRQKLMADPAFAERLSEIGRKQWETVLMRPDVRERNRASPTRAEQASKSKLPWLPREYHAEYRRMVDVLKIKSWDARKIIEAKVADDQALRSGQLGDALFWLRRLGPVTQLDDGRYRIGSAVLTPGELWQRAIVKGWQPRVAA